MKKTISILGLPLLAIATLPLAQAEVQGVAPLLKQARYWQSKGRGDLARQAYNRVLAIDPANAEARRGLAGNAPQPKAAARPQPAQAARPAPPAQAAAPAPARTAPAPARPTRTDRGGDARAAGFRALEAGQLDAAAARFRTALSANPNDADALGGMGIVRLRKSEFAQARDLLTRASRMGGAGKWAEALQSARFYADLDSARTALDKGDLAQAERLATALSQSDFRDRGPAVSVLASVYERQGRYNEAAELYRQLGKAGAGAATAQASATRNEARAALDAGDSARAEQLLRAAMGNAPDDPWVAYDLAGLLQQQGRVAEQDALVRQLSYSDKPEPLYAAALILDRAGRTGDAQAVAARIPEGQRTAEMRNFIAGLGISATIAQAKAAGARGAQGQGLAMLRQASEMRGLSADRMGALAQGMLELGDARGAGQLAAQALDAPANDAGAYDAAVRVLAQTGQDGIAMSAVQKASALAGPSLQGQRSLGNLKATLAAAQADRMRQAGQFAPAFDMLQAAWNDAPGNEEILSALARLYQSGGLNAQAAQTFRMLLAQKPADRDAMVGLIDTASASGDMETARAVTQQAIQMHPADYRVYMAAARMARTRGNDGDAARYLKTARALYMRETGMAPGAVMANGNPFAAAPQSANPFRAMAAPQPVNPFALGSNPAALSAPYAPPMGFAPQPPVGSGFGVPAPAAMPAYPPAPGYAAPAGFPGMAAPAPSYGNPVYADQAYADRNSGVTNVPADPVLAEIDQQLQQSADESGPRVDVDTGYRSRSGETGLSKLREMTGSASLSAPVAGGRVGVKATAVVLDSGRPTGSGLARFGTNATPEAQGIVDEQPSQLTSAETQHQSGVAVTASYVSKLLKLEAGVTPLGFPKEHVTGRIEVTPRLSTNATARIWADRKPVTDSIIAYAGTDDPRTGAFWGAVMKSGGGLSLSYDRNGNGVYADGSFYHYDGTAVRDNDSVEINAGGYLRAWQNARSGVSVGFNVNYQNYDNNQNYFTYGHGGYFSPQSFLSVNFPIRYWTNDGPMSIQASVAPGYQSYDQQGEPVYPTEPGAQGVLDFLKSQNSDVRSRYDSISKTGFGLSAAGAISYRVSPNTRLGGELNINTFGEYKEFKTLIGLKQNIGGN
ncbi:cellulose biosynthesis protein BcsC [Sphingobium sp. CFD-2]|uniref:cellulose biosynthesis protein BcsC n=1 Tax=Sphingobium sp. CFD-2 TaxID=2878542 RepID=UPI00214B910E|nr:cellulose biosynthesis protein BcsC [Sphingobium sp. CFD-2]